MTSEITRENTTPSEAWEGFVGDQTPAEFMALNPNLTPQEAAAQYVNDPAFDANTEGAITAEEKTVIAALLARYIEEGLTMSQEDQLRTLIGQDYSPEIIDQHDWSGFYPVVSNGKIIDIYDAQNGTPREYSRKPVINDEYMDADAPDREA
jgi:hypothetical protein